MRYILASASPRRKELFTNISEQFDIIPSQVEEIIPEGIDIEKVPEILATQKAADIAAKHPEALVIGADTGVFIDGKMLGKPRSPEEAVNMLRSLSGRTHKVITGCSLQWGEKSVSFSEVTEVTFYPLTEEEIAFLEKNGFGSEKPLGNVKRIPEAAMDAALQRFFGLGLADTYGAGLWQIGVYHKESKCYYAWRSGSNYTFVNVDQVDYNAETGHCVLMITCDIGYKITSKMTLKMEEDVFRILSNVTVSTEKPF